SLFNNSSHKNCFPPLFAPHRNLLPYSTPIQMTRSKGIDGAPPLVRACGVRGVLNVGRCGGCQTWGMWRC
ncbi:hypothetical protein ES332_D13G054100v1, partial [Gossypium tomentosum]